MDNADKAAFEKLISACLKEQRHAQNQLYKMYFSYGMSIAMRYVDDKNDAIEILNDGFLKVFTHLSSFNTDYAFRPWFKTIMVNTAINFVRKMKKFRLETDLEEAHNHPMSDQILDRIGYKDLLNLVQSLSTAYRTVFNMYVIDGFKHQEIAATLGITENTSKSNLARAKEKLREMIISKELI